MEVIEVYEGCDVVLLVTSTSPIPHVKMLQKGEKKIILHKRKRQAQPNFAGNEMSCGDFVGYYEPTSPPE
jgi:hypothetical protein